MITDSNGTSKGDAALELAEQYGFAVFPCWGVSDGRCNCGDVDCSSPGKHPYPPLAPNGFRNATTDSEFIRGAWREFPACNIGVATGKASDLFVLDLDGIEGLRAFADWTPDSLGVDSFKENVQAETGGKGRHVYFRDAGVHSSNRINGLSIDLRGDAGYVVVPPSINSKGPYRWLAAPGDGEIAEAPDWLLRKLDTRANDNGLSLAVEHDLHTHPGAPEGERNATLCKLAGAWLAEHGPGDDLLHSALKWAGRCKPPLPERQVVKSIKALAKKEQRAQPKEQVAQQAQRLEIISAADVKIEPVQWLWQDRLPAGMLSLITGDPGQGKTTVVIDVAARITAGVPFPDGTPARTGTVLFYTLEDTFRHVVVPRLLAAGGDRSKLQLIGATTRSDGSADILLLDRDLPLLRQAIEHFGDVRLLAIDPLSACLGDSVRENVNADCRRVLGPLAKLAEETGVTIWGVGHSAKDSDGRKAVHRTLGSIAFVAAARTAWCVVTDPNDDDRHLFLQQKNNLANADGLGYRLKPADIEGCNVAAVEWDATPVQMRLDDLGHNRGDDAFAEAQEFLRQYLIEPQPAKDVFKAAKLEGISERTLKAAKKSLCIKSQRQGGAGSKGEWAWHPPPTMTIEDPAKGADSAKGAVESCTLSGGSERWVF